MIRNTRSERGSTLLALLVIAVICGGLAASVLLPGMADSRGAQAALAREQAFQLAESGIDWGIAVVRRSNGAIPATPQTQQSVDGLGDFDLSYVSGGANSVDDDNDGQVDEADETDFIYLTCTGSAGDIERTIEVVLRRSVQVPSIEAAVQFNVDTPILDLKGNAFEIDGADHDLDGNDLPLATQKHGIASPADPADLIAQIPTGRTDQVMGLGGTPSVGQIPSFDLTTLVEQATAAASIQVEGGTHTNLDLGEATADGVVVAYADTDIHISGNAEGAGILVVDGDLVISGAFMWRGLVIVRGRVVMVGGGSSKRVIGGVVIGEEITAEVSTQTVTLNGTVDLNYSSEAIQLASQSLVIMSVLAWQEVANP